MILLRIGLSQMCSICVPFLVLVAIFCFSERALAIFPWHMNRKFVLVRAPFKLEALTKIDIGFDGYLPRTRIYKIVSGK